MTQLAFDLDSCICGNPIPARPVYRKPATHCSYWCHLVSKGTYTLEQVAHMIPKRENK